MSRCERCGGKDHATSEHDEVMAVLNRSPECEHGVNLGVYCEGCDSLRIRWVACSEQMPAERELVLLYTHVPTHHSGREWKGQDVGFHDGGFWIEGDSSTEISEGKVTHWAELPANPDGSAGNPVHD
jgi:hypothetical protein